MHYIATFYRKCGTVSKRRRLFEKEEEAGDVDRFTDKKEVSFPKLDTWHLCHREAYL